MISHRKFHPIASAVGFCFICYTTLIMASHSGKYASKAARPASSEERTRSEFDIQYSRLNVAQKKAVDAIEGPVMVIAGPGTGKTTILTLRIANILRKTDTPPHGILAITYTDAGVKAMRSKLQVLIGSKAHEVSIYTFHSFASAMMAEYPDHFLHLDGRRQMVDIEQQSLIREIILDPRFSQIRPLGNPDYHISHIISFIEECKRQARTPEMARQYADQEAKRIAEDPDSISSRGASKGKLKAEANNAIMQCEKTKVYADVYERYEDLKRERGKLDYSDLIIELLAALRSDELLLRLMQERFLYVLVDEHQDTNDAQNLIVALIAEFFETPNIFMVGDEKQAIYRFQGASVDNFLLLKKRWPAMELISLDTNYRSHQGILDASFAMIENNYGEGEHEDLRVRLRSGRSAKGEVRREKSASRLRSDQKEDSVQKNVRVVVGENVASIERRLAERLKEIIVDEPDATAAVIVRRNSDLDRVIKLCEANGIPISSDRSVDIFKHPVGVVYFDLIQYLVDPSRLDALAQTVVAGMWDVSADDMAEVVASIKAGKVESIIDSKLSGLSRVRQRMLDDGPIGFLVSTAKDSGYQRLVAGDPTRMFVWRGIVALAETIVRDAEIVDPMKLLQMLLDYRLAAKSRSVKVSVGAPEARIQAMTAHGSKGLEFDHVFIPYATDNSWVGRTQGEHFVLPRRGASQEDNVRDIRRLFYVALTRARESVEVLVPQEESDGKRLTELRFIAELPDEHVEKIELDRTDATEAFELAAAASRGTATRGEGVVRDAASQALIDVAKRVLLGKGLSVTALNHFMKCPNEFLYQSVLKMPQNPVASAEKGTAMHEAMAAVWRTLSSRAGVGTDERTEIIKEALEGFFAKSLLPLGEKEAVRKELLADAEVVSRALEGHFAGKGPADTVYAEHWVETKFSGNYDGKELQIPLHGKMDAILDRRDEVLVYDYKTKQAMTEKAIRGETQRSDGSYFRQLIFYKMLLSGDRRWNGKNVVPALVFVSPDKRGECPTVSLSIVDADIDRVRKEVQSVIDAVWSGEIVSMKCMEEGCEWCGLRSVYR